MAESVVKVAALEINGKNIEDFNSVTINAYTVSKQVNLMNKTNIGLMTPRYTVGIGFVEPAAGLPLDVKNIRNGTITIEYDNGKRITYGGVYTAEVGEGTIDGESELDYTVTYNAESRTEE